MTSSAALLIAGLACQALDTSSTLYGLSHGYREANPIYGQSKGRVVSFKAGLNLGMFIWRQKTERKALTVGIPVVLMSGCPVAAHNFYTMRRR